MLDAGYDAEQALAAATSTAARGSSARRLARSGVPERRSTRVSTRRV
jgi:hypothetical protein